MNTRMTNGQLVYFGGSCISFDSEDPAIANALAFHFRHCPVEIGRVIAHYKITAINETNFSVTVDGSVLFPNLTFDQVLWLLMQNGLARLNGECNTGLVFHAAALENMGEGIILCGQSGSGKSSLTAWLLATGFRYLTDEVIHYFASQDQIKGFARSLVLKRGAAFIWQHWLGEGEREGFHRFADGSSWIDPYLLKPEEVCHQTTPRLLIFPRYTPQAPLRATKLSQADTLFRLLQNLVNARNLPLAGLESATRLARRITAYNLEYSDLESASTWIRQA